MSDEAITRPTIETILDRLSAFEANVIARFDAMETRVEQFEARTAKSLQAIEDQLGVLALDTIKLRAARGDMERRLTAIEEASPRSQL